ncbi:predicted protein [Naegleria gruberi]|uniref:Predicted protein n=1 Tax=Naegleria gruberi TaxID=5762 RepID=D2VXF8_NAEGR|nr:uncharacterized protein NAEGRDRAFT_73732 [Naegleria gruberi]EFC38431.1 predicted protein [Naegleria gruberi]|eukprot:XP_002671175.1 predicted protein [Naegleria gruberi strain NEG-M]
MSKRARLYNLVNHDDDLSTCSSKNNYYYSEENQLDSRCVNYSLDIGNASEEECDGSATEDDHNPYLDSDDNEQEEEEQDLEYDIPLALRCDIHICQEEEKKHLNHH